MLTSTGTFRFQIPYRVLIFVGASDVNSDENQKKIILEGAIEFVKNFFRPFIKMGRKAP